MIMLLLFFGVILDLFYFMDFYHRVNHILIIGSCYLRLGGFLCREWIVFEWGVRRRIDFGILISYVILGKHICSRLLVRASRNRWCYLFGIWIRLDLLRGDSLLLCCYSFVLALSHSWCREDLDTTSFIWCYSYFMPIVGMFVWRFVIVRMSIRSTVLGRFHLLCCCWETSWPIFNSCFDLVGHILDLARALYILVVRDSFWSRDLRIGKNIDWGIVWQFLVLWLVLWGIDWVRNRFLRRLGWQPIRYW